MRRAPLVTALLLLAACTVGGRQNLPYHIGPATDHFDGQRFFNPDGKQGTGGAAKRGSGAFLKLALHPLHAWPSHVPVTPSVPPRRVEGQRMLVTWVGHSSVLVQTQGLNILTDPVWADRASPVSFAGPKRVRAPGIRLADLPPIDLILISHDHFDHLDTATLKTLWHRDHPRIVAGLGVDAELKADGIKVVARDWGGRVEIAPGIAVILDRAHHWSARSTATKDRTLWTGFTLTLPGGDLYYAGDTGPGDMRWAAEAAAHGPVRLAILPIGAFKFDQPESGNHIGPVDAVTAFQQLHAGYALGVHWGTFELTDEPIDMPQQVLAQTLATRGIAADRFRTTEAGEAWDVPAIAAQSASPGG